MNNAILIQQCYPGLGYEPMLELTMERNEIYCRKWQFDYQCIIDNVVTNWEPKQGGWAKIELIRRALENGYEYVVWLDTDALIKDTDVDLREGCPKFGIGACWMRIPQLHHWNVGVLYIRNSQEVRDFVIEWLSKFPGGRQWMEQGVFNEMGMKGKIVNTISDKWNATLNYSMVPDAVILAYHGNGDAKQRYELMKGTLERLEAK